MKAQLNIYVDKNEEFVCGQLWTAAQFADKEKMPDGCVKKVDCVEVEFDESAADLRSDEGVSNRFAR